MSEVLERQTDAATRFRIIDSDIHPALRSPDDLDPFLSTRWRQHRQFGRHAAGGLMGRSGTGEGRAGLEEEKEG